MAKPCEHLAMVTPEDFPPQRTPGACEECLAEGTAWVALASADRLLRFLDGKACDQTLP
jgi:hypothetical protein